MLSEQYQQLLTAYVDGELSSRQTRMAHKLLRRSSEARKLLRQLQADSRELRSLQTPALGIDLSKPILQSIHDFELAPLPNGPASAQPSQATIWVGYATAVAILLLACGASYFAFLALMPRSDNCLETNRQIKEPPAVSTDKSSEAIPNKLVDEKVAPRRDRSHSEEKSSSDNSSGVVKTVPSQAPKKEDAGVARNPMPPDQALTERIMEMIPFEKVEGSPPSFVLVHELDKDPARQKLLSDLKKGDGFRMELKCQNGVRGLERLRAVLKSEQIQLSLDAASVAHLGSAEYALLLEDVTPEELVKIMQRLAVEDKKAAAKRENQFDRLLYNKMGEKEFTELSRVLGLEPIKMNEKAVPSTKAVPRMALVLPYQGGKNRTLSTNEVKAYLQNRKPSRPGTLQVLLLIKGAGA